MAGLGRTAAGDALATCLFMVFFSLATPVSGGVGVVAGLQAQSKAE